MILPEARQEKFPAEELWGERKRTRKIYLTGNRIRIVVPRPMRERILIWP